MFWIDRYYIILVLPTVLLALYAQAKVNSTFNRYSQERSRRGMTGQEVALAILRSAGITDVPVEMVSGRLTDHYDPRSRVLRLSESVCGSTSIAAVGVAAHEAGHAIQHQVGYAPLHLRNVMIPLTRIGSNLSMPLIIIGIIMGGLSSSVSGNLGWYIIVLGIALFGIAVLFQVITLPVEFNASRRALALLREQQILVDDELGKARKVLQAAALTYVAATAQVLANLLRLLLIVGGRKRDD